MADATPKKDLPWQGLKSEFDKFREGVDIDAEWTFGDQGVEGNAWRLFREGQVALIPRLWKVFEVAGNQLAASRGAEDLVPRRLLRVDDPVARWLAALRYLNLNVRVLATAEWRVERGLVWDVAGASSYLSQALASNYPKARVKRHAMQTQTMNQSGAQVQI